MIETLIFSKILKILSQKISGQKSKGISLKLFLQSLHEHSKLFGLSNAVKSFLFNIFLSLGPFHTSIFIENYRQKLFFSLNVTLWDLRLVETGNFVEHNQVFVKPHDFWRVLLHHKTQLPFEWGLLPTWQIICHLFPFIPKGSRGQEQNPLLVIGPNRRTIPKSNMVMPLLTTILCWSVVEKACNERPPHGSMFLDDTPE